MTIIISLRDQKINLLKQKKNDGKTGYIGITTSNGVSAVFKFDASTATAVQGLKVEGGTITAVNKLAAK